VADAGQVPLRLGARVARPRARAAPPVGARVETRAETPGASTPEQLTARYHLPPPRPPVPGVGELCPGSGEPAVADSVRVLRTLQAAVHPLPRWLAAGILELEERGGGCDRAGVRAVRRIWLLPLTGDGLDLARGSPARRTAACLVDYLREQDRLRLLYRALGALPLVSRDAVTGAIIVRDDPRARAEELLTLLFGQSAKEADAAFSAWLEGR
ncbi:MAG TPA: hypothetical protein VFX98_03830, partial [Longimicrobiaceae bacterium]|nr:hypothetical protein [Longimicrobiaceae bacterium]